MRCPGRLRASAVLLLATALLAACGADDSGGPSASDDDGGGSTESHVEPETEEAPRAFDAEAAFTLTEEAYGWQPPVALDGASALVVDHGGLSVVDVADGAEVARVEPENPPLFPEPEAPRSPEEVEEARARSADSPPAVVELDGETLAFAGFPVSAADGDGAPRPAVELLAVRTDTGELHDSVVFTPRWPEDGPVERAALTVVGAGDGVVAVRVDPDAAVGSTYGVAVAEGEVVWERADFQGIGSAEGVVAGGLFDEGADRPVLAGVSLADGAEVWRSDEGERALVRMGEAGDWVEATEQVPGADGEVERLLAIATGDAFYAPEDGSLDDSSCRHDVDAAVVVCVAEEHGAVALDAEAGEVLWRDPEWGGRVTAAWRGVLYVDRADEGPVALDARTGETVEADPGVAPDLVSAHAALVHTGSTVTVHHVRE